MYACEEGFDMRFSVEGMWGQGLYFAKDASYSDKYAYKSGSEKAMFLARVLVGDDITLPP